MYIFNVLIFSNTSVQLKFICVKICSAYNASSHLHICVSHKMDRELFVWTVSSSIYEKLGFRWYKYGSKVNSWAWVKGTSLVRWIWSFYLFLRLPWLTVNLQMNTRRMCKQLVRLGICTQVFSSAIEISWFRRR